MQKMAERDLDKLQNAFDYVKYVCKSHIGKH